jgi:hypothetical protein
MFGTCWLKRFGYYHSIFLYHLIYLRICMPVWHPGLTQQLFEDIEEIQKRCLRTIYPAVTYAEALVLSGLERLDERRERFTRNMSAEIKNDNHPLHSILPHLKQSQFNLRKEYPFSIPVAKKNRYDRDTVPYSISRGYWLYSHRSWR